MFRNFKFLDNRSQNLYKKFNIDLDIVSGAVELIFSLTKRDKRHLCLICVI